MSIGLQADSVAPESVYVPANSDWCNLEAASRIHRSSGSAETLQPWFQRPLNLLVVGSIPTRPTISPARRTDSIPLRLEVQGGGGARDATRDPVWVFLPDQGRLIFSGRVRTEFAPVVRRRAARSVTIIPSTHGSTAPPPPPLGAGCTTTTNFACACEDAPLP